jgi:thiol-disulfide isomerase/thioredoxin
MSNQPRRPKPRATPSRGKKQPAAAAAPPKRNLLWVWIGLGAVIVIAAIVAIVTSGGGDDDASGDSNAPGGSQMETAPVTITGEPIPALTDEAADPAVGQAAPTISGSSFDGSAVDIDWSKGPTMVVVVAHWCPHCNREVPQLVKWKASGEVPAELQVVAISTNARPDAPNYPPSKWIADEGWTWPVMADDDNSSAAQALGVSSFPYIAIVGTDGKLITRWSGELGQSGIADRVAAALA